MIRFVTVQPLASGDVTTSKYNKDKALTVTLMIKPDIKRKNISGMVINRIVKQNKKNIMLMTMKFLQFLRLSL